MPLSFSSRVFKRTKQKLPDGDQAMVSGRRCVCGNLEDHTQHPALFRHPSSSSFSSSRQPAASVSRKQNRGGDRAARVDGEIVKRADQGDVCSEGICSLRHVFTFPLFSHPVLIISILECRGSPNIEQVLMGRASYK